jgi:hypothetical protein
MNSWLKYSNVIKFSITVGVMQSSEKKAYENLPLSSVKSPIRKVITKETKKCSPSRESNVVNVYVIDIKLGVA